jgi:hypothetical protein
MACAAKPNYLGIVTGIGSAAVATVAALRSMLEVNTLGPIILFQAFHDLISDIRRHFFHCRQDYRPDSPSGNCLRD